MTSAYIHPMRYYCDGPRCKRWADGSDVELPKGWTERTTTLESGSEIIRQEHLCQHCSAPETPQ